MYFSSVKFKYHFNPIFVSKFKHAFKAQQVPMQSKLV